MQKHVIAVHDLSGFGRCSLGVVLPILTVHGIQCGVMPAAFLSTHTGYPGFTFRDLTGELRPTADHWKTLGLPFHALYSGFLGSEEQMDIVRDTIEAFRHNDGFIALVDPVMGDHGIRYKTYTSGMCEKMKDLAAAADIVCPNLTEAAILLGEDYDNRPSGEEGYRDWLTRLSLDGHRSVVLTGVILEQGMIGSGIFNRDTRQISFYSLPFVGREYHGTGDIYASVLLGGLLSGLTLEDAVARAARFILDCATLTSGDGTPTEVGVRYEALLHKLV